MSQMHQLIQSFPSFEEAAGGISGIQEIPTIMGGQAYRDSLGGIVGSVSEPIPGMGKRITGSDGELLGWSRETPFGETQITGDDGGIVSRMGEENAMGQQMILDENGDITGWTSGGMGGNENYFDGDGTFLGQVSDGFQGGEVFHSSGSFDDTLNEFPEMEGVGFEWEGGEIGDLPSGELEIPEFDVPEMDFVDLF